MLTANLHQKSSIEELLMRKFQLPAHQIGFEALVLALLLCLERDIRYYSVELYPAIARITGQPEDGKAVAEAIHQVILKGYDSGSETWKIYFPNHTHAPSNKVFISTLVIYLKQ